MNILRNKVNLNNNFIYATINKFFNCNVTTAVTCRECHTDKKIYTKKGDKGYSSLFTGERVIKNNAFFNALGTVDELSSNLGLAKELAAQHKYTYENEIGKIQCILQDIGSILATPIPENKDIRELSQSVQKRLILNEEFTKDLEKLIDEYTKSLSPLKNFILPGGGHTSAQLHVCRAVCRRAERTIAPLVIKGLVHPEVLAYVNRLSDYLFTIARIACKLSNSKESVYIVPK